MSKYKGNPATSPVWSFFHKKLIKLTKLIPSGGNFFPSAPLDQNQKCNLQILGLYELLLV